MQWNKLETLSELSVMEILQIKVILSTYCFTTPPGILTSFHLPFNHVRDVVIAALSAQIHLCLSALLFIKPNVARQEAGLQKHAYVQHHKSTLEKRRHVTWWEHAGAEVRDKQPRPSM